MRNNPLQLLHITDPHLLANANARLHDWHVNYAFTTVLEAATRRYPDYDALVLGGDLVDDQSAAGYQRLDTMLRLLGRPILAMAGNHDDPGRMAHYLDCAHVHRPLALGGWQLHALDSHWPGNAAGRLGEAQLADLEYHLDRDTRPAVIFLHHPPVSVGSTWLDAIGLADGDTLTQCLTRRPQVRAVVCGHAHQARQLSIGDRPCWVTPATMRQFLPGADQFAMDDGHAPGYRWLSLTANGRIRSRIHRVRATLQACG